MSRYFLGIGHDSDANSADMLRVIERALQRCNLMPANVAVIASIDRKQEAGLVMALAEHFGLKAVFFKAAILEAETPRLKNPSELVFRQMGCHGVAEAAALAASGPTGELILPKMADKGITCAIAWVR